MLLMELEEREYRSRRAPPFDSECLLMPAEVGSGRGGTNTNDDIISVHAWLVLGGYLACLTSCVFSVVLVFLSPGPINAHGALRYISEGMDQHCGYATVVMGTSSLLLLACQVVAAAHMVERGAMAASLAQAIAWNVVLGVGDTGWTVHYVGLVVFLLGNLGYHYTASGDPSYGSLVYRRVTQLGALFTFVFMGIAGASILCGETCVPLRSCAVAFEFVLMFFLVAQNVCLVHALDQFQDIRLRFER